MYFIENIHSSTLMGDNSPWVSSIFPCPVRKGTVFVTDYLFKNICIENGLRRDSCFPLELREGAVTTHCKIFEFLSLQFLSYNATYCMYRYHLSPFAFFCGSLGSDIALENADTLDIAIAVNNKFLCLLLRSLMASVSIHETVPGNLSASK